MLLVVRDSIEPVKNPLHNLHNYGILWLTTSSESLSNPAGLCWVQQSQPVDSIRSVRDTSPRRKGANSNAIHNTAEKKNTKKKQSLQSASLVALQDAASARYIYTRPVTVLSCFIVWKSFQKNLEWRTSVRLAPIARMLFCSLDDPVLEYQALRTVCHHLALSSCPFLFFCPNFSMFKAEEGQKIEPYWHDTQ
jgi:hypothetical protein